MEEALNMAPTRLDRAGRRNVRQMQRKERKEACKHFKGRLKRQCKRKFKKGHMAVRNQLFRNGKKPLSRIGSILKPVVGLGASLVPGGNLVGKAFNSVGLNKIGESLKTSKQSLFGLSLPGSKGTQLETGKSLRDILGGVVDIITPPPAPSPTAPVADQSKGKMFMAKAGMVLKKSWYYLLGVLIVIAGIIWFSKNKDNR